MLVINIKTPYPIHYSILDFPLQKNQSRNLHWRWSSRRNSRLVSHGLFMTVWWFSPTIRYGDPSSLDNLPSKELFPVFSQWKFMIKHPSFQSSHEFFLKTFLKSCLWCIDAYVLILNLISIRFHDEPMFLPILKLVYIMALWSWL